MDHAKLIELGLTYKGTSLRHPFDSDLPVLFVHERMFALFFTRNGGQSVNLKTIPDEAWLQRETYKGSVLPGYHMNKQNWNTVLLNGTVPNDVITSMLEESYWLVVAKLRKADREALGMRKNPTKNKE